LNGPKKEVKSLRWGTEKAEGGEKKMQRRETTAKKRDLCVHVEGKKRAVPILVEKGGGSFINAGRAAGKKDSRGALAHTMRKGETCKTFAEIRRKWEQSI